MQTQFTDKVTFYTVYLEMHDIRFEGSIRVNDDNQIIELNGSYFADQIHIGNCNSYLNGEQLYFNYNISGAYASKVFDLADVVYTEAIEMLNAPVEGEEMKAPETEVME